MLEHVGIMVVKDVDLLLVGVGSHLFFMSCIFFLPFAFPHFLQENNDVLPVMLHLRSFFRRIDACHIPNRTHAVGLRGDSLLMDLLGFFLKLVQVFELAFKLSHNEQFFSVILDFKWVGGVVSEVFSSDLAKTEGRQPTEIGVISNVGGRLEKSILCRAVFGPRLVSA